MTSMSRIMLNVADGHEALGPEELADGDLLLESQADRLALAAVAHPLHAAGELHRARASGVRSSALSSAP
jgi:hypothetical protein